MTWEQVNKMRIKYIRYGENLFRKMLREQELIVRTALKDVQTTADIDNAIESLDLGANIRKYYEDYYIRTGVAMARMMKRNLTSRKKAITFDDSEDIWTEQMREFVATRCGTKITATTRSSYADIERLTRRALLQGTEQGLGAGDIAKIIGRDMAKMDKWKALRIARTEAVSASNEGAVLGARDTGIELKKVWLAAGGPGPSGFQRDDHQDMHETEVDMNEDFVLPDGTRMEYPGSPDAPPEHVINCRCTVAFEPKESLIDSYLNE